MKTYYAHLDIRNFYAACEQNLNPDLRGKPLVIYNQGPGGGRVIIAASKEAKALGISRDIPITQAELPGIFLIRSRLEIYSFLSGFLFQQVFHLFRSKVSSLAKPHIDDIVLEKEANLEEVIALTRDIEAFYNRYNFQTAIGISCNPAYAHLATLKYGKKYGLTYLGSGVARRLFYNSPVLTFPGIGPKRTTLLNQAGIFTIQDISLSSLSSIKALLGPKLGEKIYFGSLGL